MTGAGLRPQARLTNYLYHCTTECTITIINKMIFVNQFKILHITFFQDSRGKMNQHILQSKINHEILLLSAVKELKQKSEQKDLEIEELKMKNDEKDTSLQELQQNFNVLQTEFNQLSTKMENNEKQTNTSFGEMKEQHSKEVNQIKDNIENLQKFADTISELHLTLSNPKLRRNENLYDTLFQNKYNVNQDAMKWHNFLKQVNAKDNENKKCNYLETLKTSINQYSQTVYSPKYEERFHNVCCVAPKGLIFGDYYYVKIECGDDIRSIYFKDFTNRQKFYDEINERKSRLVCNGDHLYSYCYIGYCLHVILYCDSFYDINPWLLHRSQEERNLSLQIERKVKIGDIDQYQVNNQIIICY